MVIRMDAGSKIYGAGETAYQALKQVSFSVEEGSITAILGPSGSGKSTLLNVIGGIDRLSEGRIEVAGQDIGQLDDNGLTEYRKKKVGFVFQFYNLIPNLTVEENVEVAAHISDNPLEIESILEAVGMKPFAKRFPRELSGGQQQRVSIARALVKNPPLLLCDEPTGALDHETSREVLCLMEDINRRFGTTILIITHNPAIIPMTNQIIKLRSGEIIENVINPDPVSAERMEW